MKPDFTETSRRVGGWRVRAMSLLALLGMFTGAAGELREDFATDPFSLDRPETTRWQRVGDPSLFTWDAPAGNLAIQWDSTRPNSFCVLPLGRKLTAADAFAVSLDLRLYAAGARANSGRTNPLQVTFAFVQQAKLPAGYPLRTVAGRAQDLLDFNFFPFADLGVFGAAAYVSPAAFGHTSAAYSFGNALDLADGTVRHLSCSWDPGTRQFFTEITGAGQEPVAPTEPPLPRSDDFTVDALAIINWSESTTPHDSLRAAATLDNVLITLPTPPMAFTGPLLLGKDRRSVEFEGQVGYRYQLEASGDLVQWDGIGSSLPGQGTRLVLSDFRKALFPIQFYRVRSSIGP